MIRCNLDFHFLFFFLFLLFISSFVHVHAHARAYNSRLIVMLQKIFLENMKGIRRRFTSFHEIGENKFEISKNLIVLVPV